jgi:serine/threonine-protein kinase RsbW
MISEREIIEEIRFNADINNLSVAEGLIDRVCESEGIEADAYGNVFIAVTEAVNNAIIHGSKLNKELIVEVKVERDKAVISFTITDTGDGFDFNNLEDPTDPKNIEKPNGRGIFLMKNLADSVEYFGNGNSVKLEFKY